MPTAPIRSTASLLRIMQENPDERQIAETPDRNLEGRPLFGVFEYAAPDDDRQLNLIAHIANDSDAAAMIFVTMRDGTDLTPDLARELPLRYIPLAGSVILSSCAPAL
jgi:hypothetical protein